MDNKELPSRDKYINDNNINKPNWNVEWSNPLYKCPNCDGPVRKNLTSGIMYTTNPPIRSYKYVCMECGYIERLEEKG